jgi:hypothetical protein
MRAPTSSNSQISGGRESERKRAVAPRGSVSVMRTSPLASILCKHGRSPFSARRKMPDKRQGSASVPSCATPGCSTRNRDGSNSLSRDRGWGPTASWRSATEHTRNETQADKKIVTEHKSEAKALGRERVRRDENAKCLTRDLETRCICVGCMCQKGRQDSNLKPASEDTSRATPPSALHVHTVLY